MTKIQRIVLSGGGTGGHIYPALSIYQRLKEMNPELECLYIGTERGLESRLTKDLDLSFKSIEIQGIKRSLSLDNLKAVWLMLTASRKAKKLIKDFKPDVVVGTGGYVSAPVLAAASKLGIPSLIHEQNSVAGLTNKYLAGKVDRIATCFQAVHKDFQKYKSKIVLTGNPRGQEVVKIEKESKILEDQFGLKADLATILIFGGSRGAPAINQAGLEVIKNWSDDHRQIILVTGQNHYDEIIASLNMDEIRSSVKIVPYISNMPQVFQMIDLVVCRSGATTLTELMALGLPSILIPSPYVTNNHQEANAMALVKQGAARMIRQADLNGQVLLDEIQGLFDNPQSLDKMSSQAKTMAVVDATDKIIEELESIVS